MKKQWLLLIPALLFLCQCSGSHTTLTVSESPGTPAVSPPKSINYTDFRSAMENLDFQYLESATEITKAQQEFADALRLAVDGNFAGAERQFSTLVKTAGDSAILADSQSILDNLRFFRSEWDSILTEQPDSTNGTDDNRALAEAYRQFPKEQYEFPVQPQQVPLDFSLSGCPVIPVVINGHKYEFWLDTGASTSCLASDVAEDCGVTPIDVENTSAQTATSKRVAIQPAVINEVRIGDIIIKDHPAIILKKEDLEFKLLGLIRILKVDGIIGWNAIQNMDITLDYLNKSATIQQPVIDENMDRNLFWLGYPVVTVLSPAGIPLHFGLDTGANVTSLHKNILNKVDTLGIKKRSVLVGSAGGFEHVESFTLPALTMLSGKYALHYVNLTGHPLTGAEFIQLDGTFGSDLPANGSVRIDCTNGRLELLYPGAK